MNNKNILLALLTICFFGCNNPTKTADYNQTTNIDSTETSKSTEIAKLNDLLSSLEEPAQTFQIPSNKPSTVKGKNGTIIKVDPSALNTISGKPLGKTIQVELKELANQTQLALSGAQTVSDDKLLVSGGAYYINMTSEGENLQIKSGKSVDIQFPKIAKERMDLFYGQRDSLGKMNWSKSTETLSSKTSSSTKATIDTTKGDSFEDIVDYIKSSGGKMTPEEKKKVQSESILHETVYESIKIKQLGWINCDRFLDEPNLTNIVAKVDANKLGTISVYLLFKDINSIRNEYTTPNGSVTLTNLPINKSFKLVAYAVNGEKIYTFSNQYKVTDKQNITMTLKEDTQKGLKSLFDF